MRVSEYPKMEKALYQWFIKQREKHLPISVEIIKAKARELHNKNGDEPGGFNASNGWFANFKKRHGIRMLKICGEKLSNKAILVDPFIKRFQEKVEDLGLTPDQIYNADESGLFFKVMPNKTLVSFKETTAPGRKVSKERLTFLACTNASGMH